MSLKEVVEAILFIYIIGDYLVTMYVRVYMYQITQSYIGRCLVLGIYLEAQIVAAIARRTHLSLAKSTSFIKAKLSGAAAFIERKSATLVTST